MRKLITSDLFTAGRMMAQIGAKDIIENAAKNAQKMEDVWENGFDLMWSLFEKASTKGSEDAIYTFLAGPFEMEREEIKGMNLVNFFETVKEFAELNKDDLVPFFKLAEKSTKSK